jgi:DNA-binding CsgD family transcriptional regulator
VLPWRLDLAEAHLGLGEHDRARDLAGEQLGRLGPERSPLRARAQQLLAAAGRREAGNATTQSRRAGDVRAGDEEKHRNAAAVVGEHVAATYGHRIWPFATEHQLPGAGAEPVTTGAHLNLPRQRTGSNGETAAELTEAEVRVAALAARGYTNRQIATALLITVSTVEQHLTRVYRKLQARRRADLPLWLADADVTNTPRG